MLHVGMSTFRHCRGLSRRELLQVGGLGAIGLTLGQVPVAARGRGGEPSCIFIFLSGGPSHLETFDPKPAAPVNIRGPYGTISTSVPGIHIGELLPQIAGTWTSAAFSAR